MKHRRTWALVAGLALLWVLSYRIAFAGHPLKEFPRPEWRWALLSLAIHFYSFWLSARGWLFILTALGLRDQQNGYLDSYWKSLLFNPVAGFWGTSIGRYVLTRQQSLSGRTLVSALFLEKIFVSVATAISLVLLSSLVYGMHRFKITPGALWLFFSLGALCLPLLYLPAVRQRNRLRIVGLYALAYPCSVILSLLSLARSLGIPLGAPALDLSGRYIAGWFIGQAVFIIPQGLGIREAAFAYLMHHAMPGAWIIGFALWERTCAIAAQSLPSAWLWGRSLWSGSSQQSTRPHSEIFPDDAVSDPISREAKARRILKIIADANGRPLHTLTCLDLGCSEGLMTAVFASDFANVWGVDTDSPMIRKAQIKAAGHDNLHFLLGEAERIPLKEQSVDVVICNQVYEHVADPEKMVQEIRRVLTPSGLCYFAGRNRWGLFDGHYAIPTLSWWPHAWIDGVFHWWGYPEGYPVRLRSYLQLRRLMRDFNLQDYTVTVLKSPRRWGAEQDVPAARWVQYLPKRIYEMLYPCLPGYLWVLKPPRTLE